MVAIGKDLVLPREIGPAAVDQIHARQAVLRGDFLRAQVLLDRQRIVGAALHRRVVGDDDAQSPGDLADTRDHARAGDILVIDLISGELTDFEEGGAGVEQALDALAGQQLAARHVPLA